MKVTLLAYEPDAYDVANAAFQSGYSRTVWVDRRTTTRLLAADWNILWCCNDLPAMDNRESPLSLLRWILCSSHIHLL